MSGASQDLPFNFRPLLNAPILSTSLCILFIVSLYVVINEVFRYRACNPHFAGPRGLPVVGNIRDIRFHAPTKFQEWAKQYGDVYQVQLGNIPILVVNSAAAAKELIGGNAHAVSSRPEFYTFHKVCHASHGSSVFSANYD